MTTLTQPIKWHGGKHYLAKRIIELMPPRCQNPNNPSVDDPGWLHYVEPYFGGGSVLLAQDPEGISEVVNDINGELINFWNVIGTRHAFLVFQQLVALTPVSQEQFERALSHNDSDDWIARAWRFFIINRQSRQGLGKDFATISRNRTRRGMNEQVSAWLSAIDGLPEIHERLKRVLILLSDAMKVIHSQDGPRTLFYIDAPYLAETRHSGGGEYGDHEMSDADHARLLMLLSKIKGRFLLSGYHSTLYDNHATENDWRCVEIEIDNKASSKKSKDVKIECVWMNY